jgi:signal recognition particle GTPase
MKHFCTVSVLALLIATSSCVKPMTKDSYLKEYGEFITEIAGNCKTFDEREWEKQLQKYRKFNGEWYDRFKNDFSIKEKLIITSYKTQFNYCRTVQYTSQSLKELFETLNISEIKNRIQYYIDNDMQDDIERFYREACKAGKDAEQTVTTALRELKINIEKWKNDN